MSDAQLSLAPLGAGDLIDRAVRFYRQNFWTFIWIAAPPVLIGTLISIAWQMAGRRLFNVDPINSPVETNVYYLFLWLGSLVIWTVEIVAGLTVMGGAARNFVRHLLFHEPLSFKETYKNVKSRFFALVGASSLIALLLGLIWMMVFTIAYLLIIIAVLIAIAAFSFSPFLATIVSIALVLSIGFGAGWLFFMIAGHFVYVPQAMLVEGQSVWGAIGRSSTLARGNAKRLYALFVFTLLAIYSALALFYVPLGWYAWVHGIEVLRFEADAIPAWYEIASQFLWQASLILMMPVWMIGLCLLYVDERVRHEGYDIELMAARRLGEIPAVPEEFVNPLQAALAQSATPAASPTVPQKSSHSTLGLD